MTAIQQTPPQNQGGQIQSTQKRGVDILKSVLSAESVQEQFKNALGANSGAFVTSIIELYNSDSSLKACSPQKVVMEALKAAVLKLPINKALGYAYIIPYNVSKKRLDENGKEVLDPRTHKPIYDKVMEPSFQMGYKGYIQLAMRTGQYRTINADFVYEGELRTVDKLTGEIRFDGEKKSDKIVGYFCYFELLNGFSKTLYMSVEDMARHAKKYSKSVKKETTVDILLNIAQLPVLANSNVVGWQGDFHNMAIKTVIRAILSKYGYLSIEMQNAISDDYKGDSVLDVTEEHETATLVDPENVEYVEVSSEEDGKDDDEEENQKEEDINPGY